MVKKILIFLIALLSLQLYSQDPASVKWLQIKTKNFKLVFPSGYDSVAKKVGKMLLLSNDDVAYSLKCKPKPITIILHNRSSISNGWVSIAPKVSEFFHTPTQQSMSPLDWYQSLVLHEYRHVVQFEKIKQGTMGEICYGFYGDIGWAFKSAPSPNWFFEGDAVATETALSKAGRGRSPDFSREIRAQVIDKKIYSYSKAVCGSYNDKVPNHYELGYHLVAYGRRKWDAGLWETAHQFTANRLGFTPFNKGIIYYTGRDKYSLYQEALDSLKFEWIKEINEKSLSNFDTIKTIVTKTYTNYKYPAILPDSSIIALKSGMGDIPNLVIINSCGQEQKIRDVASIVTGNPIKTNGQQIVWVEDFPDLRWNLRSYSDVILYDLISQKKKRLSHKQHYYAPTISPDGSKIAVVEVTDKSLYNVVILNSIDGSIIQTIPSPSNDFVFTPQWANDSINLICILQNETGKALSKINTLNKTFTQLTEYLSTDISDPIVYKNYIIYSSEMNGKNNEIFAFDTISKQHYILTNSKYGCRYPWVSGENMIISVYTADGDKLMKLPFDNRTFTPVEFHSPEDNSLVKALIKDEKPIPNLSDTTMFTFNIKPYRRGLHLLNIHSWGIGINTNNNDENRTESDISFMSQNKLGTFQIVGGYRYDNLGSKKLYATFYCLGWYPILQLDLEGGYHGYPLTEKQKKSYNDIIAYYERKICNQVVSFPFNLSSYNYNRYLTFSFINSFQRIGSWYIDQYNHKELKYENIGKFKFDGYSDYISLKGRFSNLKSSPVKNIYSQYGQILIVSYSKYVPILEQFQSQNKKSSEPYFYNYANRYSAKGILYLPGPIKHHSVKLISGYSFVGETPDGGYSTNPISSEIEFARGYLNNNGNNSKAYFFGSFNYTFTLVNPDITIPKFLYIKRIKTNLFADYSNKNYTGIENIISKGIKYTSFGFELIFENHILNIPYSPINMGMRLSSIDAPKGSSLRGLTGEFIFSMELF